jgi:hypothetical protein
MDIAEIEEAAEIPYQDVSACSAASAVDPSAALEIAEGAEMHGHRRDSGGSGETLSGGLRLLRCLCGRDVSAALG